MQLSREQMAEVLNHTNTLATQCLSPSERANGRLSAQDFLVQLIEYIGSVADALYQPDKDLIAKLNEYAQLDKIRSNTDKGRLMEEIACLCFRSTQGCESIKSYTSYAEQHDLVVSGNSDIWDRLLKYLDIDKRIIVVEAKYHNSKLTAEQFSRLCYMLQNKFDGACQLGIFFAHKGASGFDSIRCLSNARAVQVLFHVKTGIYIIVLDQTDINRLGETGSFLKLIAQKIKDVKAVAKVDMSSHLQTDWKEIQLPPHLSKYF